MKKLMYLFGLFYFAGLVMKKVGLIEKFRIWWNGFWRDYERQQNKKREIRVAV